MGKDTKIRFVGQPIFKQIMSLIDAVNIQGLILKHNSDRYYKAFKSRMHVVTMLFGILSRCDSMTGICEGLRASGCKGLSGRMSRQFLVDAAEVRYFFQIGIHYHIQA